MWRAVISVALVAGGGCSRKEAPAPTEAAQRLPRLWDAPSSAVQSIRATMDGDKVELERVDDRFWCRVVRAGRTFEFPVEPTGANKLIDALRGPTVRRALGKKDTAARGELGLDGRNTITVVLPAGPRSLEVGNADASNRYVLDPTTQEVLAIDGSAWTLLGSAERLLPLRKLVDRRDLKRATLRIGEATHVATRDGDGWTADDAAVAAIVTSTLRLQPGTFDRDRDVSALRPVLALDFEATTGTQHFELYAEPGDPPAAFHVRASRGIGVAQVHKPPALELFKAAKALTSK